MSSMELALLKVEIKYEHDVVLARQRARQIAELLGFESQDQVRIATTISELARNAFQYAGGGKVEFSLIGEHQQSMRVLIRDSGKGIPHLEEVLSGNYQSPTGMGVGVIGAKRLMDYFHAESSLDGTTITVHKDLPRRAKAITKTDMGVISEKLAKQDSYDPFQELQRQNQEVLAALSEVQKQRSALTQLNQELEETNRGVVALYAELDERADYLKRASELKTQFLSNMTHELRTPLNSILSISQILLDHMDGELNSEQQKQVEFIQAGAKSLSDLVNDLLDLAKVEAGKVTIRPAEFEVDEMFRMLRGMLKPLIESKSEVELIFDDSLDLPPIFSDEGKISQILRNFISNGLKYTEKGTVRVSAKTAPDKTMIFSVSDSGIGIAPENQERIFEEFTQIENMHQQKIKGTGLGLPLSRKLAELLGGYVQLTSTPGEGSVFSLVMPIHYNGPEEALYHEQETSLHGRPYERILIIDDNPADRYVIKKLVEGYADTIIEASNGQEGLALADDIRPSLIILDLVMPDIEGREVLQQLKKQKNTRAIPVLIHTSKLLSGQDRKQLDKAADILTKGSVNKGSIAKTFKSLKQSMPAKESSYA